MGEVEVDELRVRQVVLNLLTNAVKFTPDGGRITVEAHRDGAEVVITVTDTGVGVPEGDRERIFEAFFRGPQAKPHRMALMTVVCVLSAIYPTYATVIGERPLPVVVVALWIVILGGLITAWRRLVFIAAFLRKKSHP